MERNAAPLKPNATDQRNRREGGETSMLFCFSKRGGREPLRARQDEADNNPSVLNERGKATCQDVPIKTIAKICIKNNPKRSQNFRYWGGGGYARETGSAD